MPLTEAQRQTIREYSKDEAACQRLLALYEDVSGGSPPLLPLAESLQPTPHCHLLTTEQF